MCVNVNVKNHIYIYIFLYTFEEVPGTVPVYYTVPLSFTRGTKMIRYATVNTSEKVFYSRFTKKKIT